LVSNVPDLNADCRQHRDDEAQDRGLLRHIDVEKPYEGRDEECGCEVKENGKAKAE